MMTTLYSYGIGTLLTIIFMVLKLTEVISWSWWIVFFPLGIEIGFGVCLIIIVLYTTIKLRM